MAKYFQFFQYYEQIFIFKYFEMT